MEIVLKKSMVGAIAVLTLAMGSQALAAEEIQTKGKVELVNSKVSPFAVENVGGGTWDYGTKNSGSQKHCWSHYNHPENYHSSTAKVGSSTDKAYADAGEYSKADAYGPKDKTGYAYWDNEATAPK
ncbi:lactococcin 972 family bacteriocin [Brevibacillus porteri]|uniref:lactococcin 972 family bacteriocin n=1 Tax=Brevibacillus porteri TaxID=2126350 RepID=UPI003D1D75A3